LIRKKKINGRAYRENTQFNSLGRKMSRRSGRRENSPTPSSLVRILKDCARKGGDKVQGSADALHEYPKKRKMGRDTIAD